MSCAILRQTQNFFNSRTKLGAQKETSKLISKEVLSFSNLRNPLNIDPLTPSCTSHPPLSSLGPLFEIIFISLESVLPSFRPLLFQLFILPFLSNGCHFRLFLLLIFLCELLQSHFTSFIIFFLSFPSLSGAILVFF